MKERGPSPAEIRVECIDCGKIRWFYASYVSKSGRCRSCYQRWRHAQKAHPAKAVST